jgi:hypothetical protein
MVFTQIWYLHNQALQDQNKGITNCAEFTLQWRNNPIWRHIVNSTTLGNMPCVVLSLYNIVQKFGFFPDRTEWWSFHKFPDFSCSRCMKSWIGNAPICASTVLECSCFRIHRYVATLHFHLMLPKSVCRSFKENLIRDWD